MASKTSGSTRERGKRRSAYYAMGYGLIVQASPHFEDVDCLEDAILVQFACGVNYQVWSCSGLGSEREEWMHVDCLDDYSVKSQPEPSVISRHQPGSSACRCLHLMGPMDEIDKSRLAFKPPQVVNRLI